MLQVGLIKVLQKNCDLNVLNKFMTVADYGLFNPSSFLINQLSIYFLQKHC
jgi:O-antigen/teichoic acid export membrane protein